MADAKELRMNEIVQTQYTAFKGARRIAGGDLMQVARTVKEFFKDMPVEGVMIFDDMSSHLVDIDFRGTADDVLNRIAPTVVQQEPIAISPAPEPDSPRGPGR